MRKPMKVRTSAATQQEIAQKSQWRCGTAGRVLKEGNADGGMRGSISPQ